MAEYATLAELKREIGTTRVTDDPLLQEKLERAQKWFEDITGRVFISTAATYYYREDDIDDDGRLYLGTDWLSVTTLTNGDGTTLASTTYWLEPRNDSRYNWIRLKSGYSWEFDTDGEISVAGYRGYSSTPPADVKQAVLRLAAYSYKLRDAQVFDVTASPELGIITTPKGIPEDVMKVVNYYRWVR